MALLWEKQHGDVLYQVRNAGQTMRLYANNVLHSEYHPEKIVTHSVWDLMLATGFFVPPQQCKRILVLGLGGGTLVHQLLHFFEPEKIVSVELDPFHIQVAKDFFGLDDQRVELHQGDARDWVEQNQDQPGFDLVVEDLFSVVEEDAARAFPVTKKWFSSLSRLVQPHGVLTINFADWREFTRSPVSSALPSGWKSVFRLATPDCHNAIVSWQRDLSTSQQLRNRLREEPLLDPDRLQGLRYTMRRAVRFRQR